MSRRRIAISKDDLPAQLAPVSSVVKPDAPKPVLSKPVATQQPVKAASSYFPKDAQEQHFWELYVQEFNKYPSGPDLLTYACRLTRLQAYEAYLALELGKYWNSGAAGLIAPSDVLRKKLEETINLPSSQRYVRKNLLSLVDAEAQGVTTREGAFQTIKDLCGLLAGMPLGLLNMSLPPLVMAAVCAGKPLAEPKFAFKSPPAKTEPSPDLKAALAPLPSFEMHPDCAGLKQGQTLYFQPDGRVGLKPTAAVCGLAQGVSGGRVLVQPPLGGWSASALKHVAKEDVVAEVAAGLPEADWLKTIEVKITPPNPVQEMWTAKNWETLLGLWKDPFKTLPAEKTPQTASKLLGDALTWLTSDFKSSTWKDWWAGGHRVLGVYLTSLEVTSNGNEHWFKGEAEILIDQAAKIIPYVFDVHVANEFLHLPHVTVAMLGRAVANNVKAGLVKFLVDNPKVFKNAAIGVDFAKPGEVSYSVPELMNLARLKVVSTSQLLEMLKDKDGGS